MPIDKKHILEEIKRTAAANGDLPLGRHRFFAETGIKDSDWLGIHWVRWSDAIREAGYSANEFTKAYDREELFRRYADFAKELGKLPISAELRMKSRNDPEFPSESTFKSRIGTKAKLVEGLRGFCSGRDDYEIVCRLCDDYLLAGDSAESELSCELISDVAFGYVYLVKSGRYYKIGFSNAAGRREYELAIQLPEKLTTVHTIRTDDPPGIEAYWHNRFKDKRKNGEWFDLTAADISAFKRRKFM